MSAAGRALSEALDRPEDWEIDRHTATHIPSKTVWWHANGSWFFDGYEQHSGALGLVERHALYRKFRRMQSAKVAAALAAVTAQSAGSVTGEVQG